MRILITGVTGFVGSHLAEYCLSRGSDVLGTVQWRSRTENIEHLTGQIDLTECDLRDAASVNRLVSRTRPDRVFHLAAQSLVPTSWHAPAETLTNNIVSQVNLFEAVRNEGASPRILIAGSSEEYGLCERDEVPITEATPLRPLSPYGVSKVAQDLLAYQYHRSYGMHLVRTRAFNHTGPRRPSNFVVAAFASQIARIEAARQEPVLRVGNLEAVRDFSDVRDVVRAYWLALEHCEPGEVYNIASGVGYSMREMLDLLLGLSDARIEVRQDPDRMRPSDVPVLIGDSARFRNKTGWRPEIPFEVTLRDTLEFWRQRVGADGA